MKLRPEYDHGMTTFQNGKIYKGKLNFVDIFASDTEHEFFHKFICEKLKSPIDVDVLYLDEGANVKLRISKLNVTLTVKKNTCFYPDVSIVTSDYINIALDEVSGFEGWQVFAANIEVFAE